MSFWICALGYDREAAPSLQGFIQELAADDFEIKRDMEQERDEVRIMTVHGAKGLQAPIVFLPDTCMVPRAQGPRIFSACRVRAIRPARSATSSGRRRDIQTSRRSSAPRPRSMQAELEEYHRLLYVAMTRARDRLYVCGWQGAKQREKGCWYDLVQEGLQGLLSEATAHDGVSVQRLISAQTRRGQEGRPRAQRSTRHRIYPTGRRRRPPPSGRALRSRRRGSGLSSATAMRSRQSSRRLGRRPLPRTSVSRAGGWCTRCCNICLSWPRPSRSARHGPSSPRGGAIFPKPCERRSSARRWPSSATRVSRPCSGREASARCHSWRGSARARTRSSSPARSTGWRCSTTPCSSSTTKPIGRRHPNPAEVALGYIAQLAAYRLALRGLFPGRTLRAAIVWTDGPKLMEIPSTLLDDAERRILAASPQP